MKLPAPVMSDIEAVEKLFLKKLARAMTEKRPSQSLRIKRSPFLEWSNDLAFSSATTPNRVFLQPR